MSARAVTLARAFFRAVVSSEENLDAARFSDTATAGVLGPMPVPLPPALHASAQPLVQFLVDHLPPAAGISAEEAQRALLRLDSLLSSVLDAGALAMAAAVPAATVENPAAKAPPPHVIALLRAIQTLVVGNASAAGDAEAAAAATTRCATLVGRLLRAVCRCELNGGSCFPLVLGPNVLPPTLKGGRGNVNSITRIVYPSRLISKEALESHIPAMALMQQFVEGLCSASVSASAPAPFCIDADTLSAVARTGMHPSLVVDIFVEAGFQLVESVRQRNSSARPSFVFDGDLLRELAALKPSGGGSSSPASLLLQAFGGSVTTLDCAVAHYVSVVGTRLKELSVSAESGGANATAAAEAMSALATESHKAVFGIAFLFQQLSATATTTSSCEGGVLLSLETALSYLAVLLGQVTAGAQQQQYAFSSQRGHAALAEITAAMSRHAASAFTEIIVDKRAELPEVPGQLEIIGNKFYALKYPVPRPALQCADVSSSAAAAAVGLGPSGSGVATVTVSAGVAATTVCAEQQAAAGTAPQVVVFGPPTVATFVVWLLRLGEAAAARQCILTAMQDKAGWLSRKFASAVLGDAPLPAANIADAAAAAASSTATATLGCMNLFLAPCALSTPGSSVCDAVAAFILSRLAGAAELEQDVRRAGSNNAHQQHLDALDAMDAAWSSDVWPLMRLARSHLAGYAPVLLHGLIFLRAGQTTLNCMNDEHQRSGSNNNMSQPQLATRLRQLSSRWLQHVTAFLADFLAPCQLVLPPIPVIANAAGELLDALRNRVDQRRVIQALPSHHQLAEANTALLSELLSALDNNSDNAAATTTKNSGENSAAAAASGGGSIIFYPAEKIALLRHNAVLHYCVSRITEKDVKEFSILLHPVLHACPKLVIDKLLGRAIAYPSVDLQLTSALLLRDAPPLVFTLLPVMAVDRMQEAIRAATSTAGSGDTAGAEQKVSAVATLVTLAWRHNWDAFAHLHVFDAVEEALAEPTRGSLLLVIPLFKSMLLHLQLRACEGDLTYGAPQFAALRGGPLLRWWAAGSGEMMQQRWLPGLFTPATLEADLWRGFLEVLRQRTLGLRLLWGLLQAMRAVQGIFADARGSAEGNTLRALIDTDTLRDLCGILIDVIEQTANPRDALEVLRALVAPPATQQESNQTQKTDAATTNATAAAAPAAASSSPSASASAAAADEKLVLDLFKSRRVATFVQLANLISVAPRSFALLHSAERQIARAKLLLLPQQQQQQQQQQDAAAAAAGARRVEEERQLLMQLVIAYGRSDESDESTRLVDPVFGVALAAAPNTAAKIEPVSAAVASELELFAVFWLLELSDIAPLNAAEFAVCLADAKSRIADFTQRADRNCGVQRSNNNNEGAAAAAASATALQQSPAYRRARQREFDPRDSEALLVREQETIVLAVAHRRAQSLLARVLLRNRRLFVASGGDGGGDDDGNDAPSSSSRLQQFAHRLITCCLLPRAVASMSNALATAAFVEQLFHIDGQQLEDEDDSNNTNASTAADDDDDDDDAAEQSRKALAVALKHFAVALAHGFVRAYCATLASLSPDEAKRGVVCLCRLFWFAARHTSAESFVELSAFVTQSVFGVLFVKKAAASAEGLDRGTDGNTVPEFIQRTALNVVDALRAGPPLPRFAIFDTAAAGVSSAGTDNQPSLLPFPASIAECRALLPAVAAHARSSSPLFATATKLFHHLKSRCASAAKHQQQQTDAEDVSVVDDAMLSAQLGAAVAALLSKPQQQQSSAIPRHRSQLDGGSQQNRHEALDDAYEAAMQVLLRSELAQIREAAAAEAGGALPVDGEEEDEEEERDDDEEGSDVDGQDGENRRKTKTDNSEDGGGSRSGGDDDDDDRGSGSGSASRRGSYAASRDGSEAAGDNRDGGEANREDDANGGHGDGGNSASYSRASSRASSARSRGSGAENNNNNNS